MLQDSIINNSVDVDHILTEIINYYPDILNKKDPLCGDTPMILAAQNNLFEILIFTNCFVKFFTIF
jgi:hypothetical protein